jgi:preprotein translocase subunit SecA
MITSLFAKIFGTNNSRQLKELQPIVDNINKLEPSMQALSDDALAHKTVEFRERLSAGQSLNQLLPEAFAVVREASRRKLGQRHYDVQLIGGIVLHQGKIAEMKTGEGKTLTATLALYLNALPAKGVHLVTVNDYLADRDAEWMKPVYEFLGLTVASLKNQMDDRERKIAYNADILYATNNELGFDYLRDNMKFRLEDYVQRELYYAIVDEVDSILIDEARTPLIISGSAEEAGNLYQLADAAVRHLRKSEDYELDEKERNVQLTESGIDKMEKIFSVKNLFNIEHLNLLHHINQALRAHVVFKRDVEYVVKDGEVLIVDEFTGRILPGRRYSDGLHQAIEAKERVQIENETQTLATITLQNYFRLYKKLAGMTGTAATEAEEFYKIYKLDVVVIPTNKPMVREDKPDLIFLNKDAKAASIVKDVKERYEKRQPVLIGTVAVESSEELSEALKRAGIPHEVLNAKQHAREAEIVAHAGEPGHITIATNMAGRGTDIKLTAESLASGGLYILGTERHESRRIDNQLRGRSGRQGDVGESRFYISLEDDLVRRFAGETLKKNMERVGMKADEVIESRLVSRNIERAQEKVEKQNFEVRKHLLEYDDVLNQQRTVIYNFRRDILDSNDQIYLLIRDLIAKTVQTAVARFCPARTTTAADAELALEFLSKLTGVDAKEFNDAGINLVNTEIMQKDLIDFLLKRYELYRGQFGNDAVTKAEKWVMLETIDQAWKQHMLNLDHLKEGIGLRSWGQKNPLIEYKREAFAMFKDMMDHVRFDIIHQIFNINFGHFNHQVLEQKRERELEQINMISSNASDEPVQRKSDKVGRNELCTCGSGKKYKKCCGE